MNGTMVTTTSTGRFVLDEEHQGPQCREFDQNQSTAGSIGNAEDPLLDSLMAEDEISRVVYL